MKPIERIAIYLQFKSINPHSFERKIHLSNGYFAKQLRNLGSIGTDILLKIHVQYPDLNLLWVLTGEGEMISSGESSASQSIVNEFPIKYESENKKLKNLELDVEKLHHTIKDKEKIIGLYEFMMNNHPISTSISEMR